MGVRTLEVIGSLPAEFSDRITSELKSVARVAKAANVTLE